MKKQYSILSLGLVLAGYNLGFSQETKIQPCATYEAMESHFAADPAARASYEAKQKALYQEYLEYSKNKAANRTAAVEYTVPVVFHILHQGGPENIPDINCVNALKQVNEDFSRMGADTGSIFAPFKSLYINSDIKFMLAKKDPQGNCINGIVRHLDPKSNWSQGAAQSSSYWTYTWDPTRYLNIYVVANIVPQGTVTGGGIIVGYTYKPGTWATGNAHDAIVYRYSNLGYGPPQYDARSLTHEIGHWLNLSHTFGNTNNPGVSCGDDGLGDTPVTKGNFSSCPASSTNTNYVCSSPSPTNINLYFQNVENIMDYSSCAKNFTSDQTNAMRSALTSTNSNNNSGRLNLITASNLGPNFTDVNGPGICPPIADFMSVSNTYTVCSGGTLNMKDVSSTGTVTAWQWSAPAGVTIAAPNNSITLMTFNNVGVISVTLTVSNAQGSDTQVRNVTVVNGAAGINGPFMESFEVQTVPPGWSLTNTPNAFMGFQQTVYAALDQGASNYVEGAFEPAGMVSTLTMPVVDLLNNPGTTFSFGYAYARAHSAQNDAFKVQFSKDCGGVWTDVVSLTASQMQAGSGGVTAVSFTPSLSEWKIVNVDQQPTWFNYVSSPNVTIRFVFEEAGYGNNFYLDAINFSVPTGVNELTKSIRLNLYPNPSTGESQLKFNLNDVAQVKVSVVDVLGKVVLPETAQTLSAGEHVLPINKDQKLAKGVYFVNLSLNGANMSRKLIIE